MTVRYLVLSGELPGEGFWCTALSYEGLVQRVREVWGGDFNPVFKYNIAADPVGGEEELRYVDEGVPYAHRSGGVASAGAGGAMRGGASLARAGRCAVVINDGGDFDLWLRGGAAALLPPPHHNTQRDVFHHVNHRCGGRPAAAAAATTTTATQHHVIVDDVGAAGTGVVAAQSWTTHGTVAVVPNDVPQILPLTAKLFAFRNTAVAPRASTALTALPSSGVVAAVPPSAAGEMRAADAAVLPFGADCPTVMVVNGMVSAPVQVHPSKHGLPMTCSTSSTARAHGGEGYSDASNVTGSAHPYFNSVRGQRFVPRSSPAVKCADVESEDIVRPPMYTLVPPRLLCRLGVRAVLRHSSATEVILFAPNDGGVDGAGGTDDVYECAMGSCGAAVTAAWGRVVQKARAAWGVHQPVFRYLDLSLGFTQVTITTVQDYIIWANGVGRLNPELLVLEKRVAPELVREAAEGSAAAAAVEAVVLAPSPPPKTAVCGPQGRQQQQRQVAPALLRPSPPASSSLAACNEAANIENARRYRAAVAPPNFTVGEDLHPGTHLPSLMARLEALEREEIASAVARHVPLPALCLRGVKSSSGREATEGELAATPAGAEGEEALPAVAQTAGATTATGGRRLLRCSSIPYLYAGKGAVSQTAPTLPSYQRYAACQTVEGDFPPLEHSTDAMGDDRTDTVAGEEDGEAERGECAPITAEMVLRLLSCRSTPASYRATLLHDAANADADRELLLMTDARLRGRAAAQSRADGGEDAVAPGTICSYEAEVVTSDVGHGGFGHAYKVDGTLSRTNAVASALLQPTDRCRMAPAAPEPWRDSLCRDRSTIRHRRPSSAAVRSTGVTAELILTQPAAAAAAVAASEYAATTTVAAEHAKMIATQLQRVDLSHRRCC